jgi:hypothetical protein
VSTSASAGYLAEPRECKPGAAQRGVRLALVVGEQLKESGLKRLGPAGRPQLAVTDERLQDVVADLPDPLTIAADRAAAVALGGER